MLMVADPISAEKLHQYSLSDFGDITPSFPTQGVAEAIRGHRFARTAIDRMQAEWERKRVMREQSPKDWDERKGDRGKRGRR